MQSEMDAIWDAKLRHWHFPRLRSLLASGTRSIILCPDLDSTTTEDGTVVPDHAKRLKAVMHSVHTIKDIDIEFDSIYVTVFDEPTDPDEFIRKRGGDAFIKLLRDALPWWEYVYKKSKR